MRLIGYVLWCTDQQNKVIKWTTAWERWMNQQTFSLQLLFKTRPCKTSWQTEFTCFIWGGQMLWLLWAAYENILCVQYMSSLLWNNSVVILNTYCCDHASAWTDLNPEKTCLSAQRKRQRPHFIGWFGIIMLVLSLSNSLCAYQGCVPFRIELRVLFKF